jgi:hypothetical protein
MQRDEKFQLAGWGLFVICAIFFIISSVQSGDGLLLVGSILFLLACFLFIIPLLWKK